MTSRIRMLIESGRYLTGSHGMKKTLAILFIWTCVVIGVGAQQNFDAVQIKALQVAPNIWMLEGAGGNIGVSVGEDGVLLIDDQFAPMTEKIVAAVRKITDKPIRFLVNTHWHGD